MIPIIDRLWPGVAPAFVWGADAHLTRLTQKRLHLVLLYMNAAAKMDVGSTYLSLMCKSRSGLVYGVGADVLAYEAGFRKARKRVQWKSRLEWLEEHAFIAVEDGPIGSAHFILVHTPLRVLADLFDAPRDEDNDDAEQLLEVIELGLLEDGIVLNPPAPFEDTTFTQEEIQKLSDDGDEVVAQIKDDLEEANRA